MAEHLDSLATETTAVIHLGRLALAFGRVDRIAYYEDGVTPESDTDHTVMLGLVACAFAARHFPDLDLGRVAQYALVHDLVEVYAGDTPTLQISAAQRLAKHEREMAALERIERELGDELPWVAETIRSYEARQDREARYVKALDKLVPAVTNILNDGAELRRQGMGRDELAAWVAAQGVALLGYAGDFPALLEFRTDLMRRMLAIVWDGEAA